MNSHQLQAAADTVLRRWPSVRPAAALLLGSGWGGVVEAFEVRDEIPYAELPGLGATGVAGHFGRLAWAVADGVETLVFQGRRHYYEGGGWTPVALPIFLMKRLGVRTVLITNAAGGIRAGMKAGDLMVLRDHINLMGLNPLIGPHDAFWGARFPDQSAVYSPRLADALVEAARAAGAPAHEGVYLAVTGPTYETPAEVRALARLGADAVGMSTVPEAMLASAAGLEVAGLSCISNLAAGLSPTPLSHEEVAAAALQAMPRMRAVVSGFWKRLGTDHGTRPGQTTDGHGCPANPEPGTRNPQPLNREP